MLKLTAPKINRKILLSEVLHLLNTSFTPIILYLVIMMYTPYLFIYFYLVIL